MNGDERDYAEEAFNASLLHDEDSKMTSIGYPATEDLTLGDLVAFLKENQLICVPTYSGSVRVVEGYEDMPVQVVGNITGQGRLYLMISEDDNSLCILED